MHFCEKSTEYNRVSDQTWSTAVFAWRASSSPSSCQTSAQSFGIQGHSADSAWYSRCRAWSKWSTSKTTTASLGNMQPSTAPSACWGCQISLHSFYSSRNIFSPGFLPARNAMADFCIFLQLTMHIMDWWSKLRKYIFCSVLHFQCSKIVNFILTKRLNSMICDTYLWKSNTWWTIAYTVT